MPVINISGTNVSCGVRQLWGFHVATIPDIVKHALARRAGKHGDDRGKFAQYVFSDSYFRRSKSNYVLGCDCERCTEALKSVLPTPVAGAEELAHYIEVKKLGTVIKSPIVKSPNTGNYIRTYIWTLPDEQVMTE
jgi:hypothetical protein